MKTIVGILLSALVLGSLARAGVTTTRQIHCESAERSDWVLDGIFGGQKINSSIAGQQTVYDYKGRIGSSTISHLVYSAGANSEHRIFIEDLPKDSAANETRAFYYHQGGTSVDFECVISDKL